jgi:ATP/maltotriose-dependent transcriptional regulator MalT
MLTRRENEVLALIAAGYTNGEIADHLVISRATVKTHVNRIFCKLEVPNRVQAVLKYAERNSPAGELVARHTDPTNTTLV